MKTNRKKVLVTLAYSLCLSLLFTSCGSKKNNTTSSSSDTSTSQEHIHIASTSWSYDSNYHWHDCECGEKLDKALHSFEDGKCKICGYEKTEFSVGFQYDLKSDNTYALVDLGTCTDENIVIPSTYNGLPVTSIEESAISYTDHVKSIKIPDTVTQVRKFVNTFIIN